MGVENCLPIPPMCRKEPSDGDGILYGQRRRMSILVFLDAWELG